MYRDQDNLTEYVSVVGTDAFMDFVESIKDEGIILERKPMGEGNTPTAPIVVEIDKENLKKDIEKLDIEIPIMSPRIYREYKNLSDLMVSSFKFKPGEYRQFSEEEKREIIFKDIAKDEVAHVTTLDNLTVTDYQSVIGYFARLIMSELRLVSGFDILCGKVKEFVEHNLFGKNVDLADLNTLRNLSETEVSRTIIETFKKHINELTVKDKGEAEIRDYIKISKSRPFVVKNQAILVPQKSVFNRIVGDSHLELEFAAFLERCPDIISYAKNYFAVNFRIDYKNAVGEIKNYYPDYFVKNDEKNLWIIELKGEEDLDDELKIKRLSQWCDDINKQQNKIKYLWLYVKQEDFNKYKPQTFQELVKTFGE